MPRFMRYLSLLFLQNRKIQELHPVCQIIISLFKTHLSVISNEATISVQLPLSHKQKYQSISCLNSLFSKPYFHSTSIQNLTMSNHLMYRPKYHLVPLGKWSHGKFFCQWSIGMQMKKAQKGGQNHTRTCNRKIDLLQTLKKDITFQQWNPMGKMLFPYKWS